MKINQKSQLGLLFTQEMRDFILRNQSAIIDSFPIKDLADKYKNQVKDIISDENNKNYIFTKTAIEVCNKIKIDKFEPTAIKIKSYKKITFLLGDDRFYRFIFKDNELYGLIGRIENKETFPQFRYCTFKIYPELDTVNYPDNPENYMQDKYFAEFLRLLIFFEYSDTEIKELKPNQKTGTKREGKYFNESNKNVTIVDSNWNNIIVRNEAFGVSGHFRLQPTGEGRKERKLIYISEFTKSGYIRGVKKQEQTTNNN